MHNYEEINESVHEVLENYKYNYLIQNDLLTLIKNCMDNNFIRRDVAKLVDKLVEEDSKCK